MDPPPEQANSISERGETIADVSCLHSTAWEKARPADHEEMLLREMQHRVANSLQIVASILSLKARTVHSEEARLHLLDARGRVLSVAAVQRQLLASEQGGEVAIGPYLTDLCSSLAESMIRNHRVSVVVDAAATMESNEAVSLGLIVTELVINALKHAFPDNREGQISVTYRATAPGWNLSVCDDGIGRPHRPNREHRGLGTRIIETLARRLDARVEIGTGSGGTRVSVTHPA